MNKTRVAILGAGFIADIHAECYKNGFSGADVVAVYARDIEKARAFALRHGIERAFSSIDALFAECEVDVADVCLPNKLHHYACVTSARAGAHVIVEKPLCFTLKEADEMIAECEAAGVRLMYAEEMCFAPKYERAIEIMGAGAIGNIYRLKHAGRHSGPHNRWFYDTDAGGGAMFDMGCHSIGWFLHALERSGKSGKVSRVFARLDTVYHDTKLDDEGIIILECDGGVTAIGEAGWARKGAAEDRIELAGTGGVIEADLCRGISALVYSENGYDYSGEKAGDTRGYSFMAYEEAYNNGYPQELRHFINAIRNGTPNALDGSFGRRVLEIVIAAYVSAATGTWVTPGQDCLSFPAEVWINKE